MAAVPGATDALAALEAGYAFADCNDVTDDFMPGDDGEGVPEVASLFEGIGVADSAGEYFDEDLPCRGRREGEVLQFEGGALFLEDKGFEGLGEFRSHCQV
jgi:hypothetical protein